MASDSPTPVTELTQELRLATTMTGGVSLAIWMGGVAREINLLSQASQWRRAGGEYPDKNPLSEPATASLKLYAKLIDLLDVVVDVDVLSGTSAGGINAALLGWSRATGCDLGGLRDLWLDLGALTDLIRDPAAKSTPSLLYGDERMFAALEENLPEFVTGPFPPARFQDSLGSQWRPSTTLNITTTLLTGEVGRFTDSFGTLVQDEDRHGLFTFTQTQLAQSDDAAAALALAARSSASFPGAFEPSFIPFLESTAKQGGVPARPPMAEYANITRSHWVADGGLLDNRPIGALLQSIFDRPAKRPVRRVLLFVVPSSGPSPDMVEQAPPDDVSKPFGLVDGLLKDLAAMTTQSIASDLRAIRLHQDRLDARTDTRLRLAELGAKLAAGSRLLTESVLEDYLEREATKQARALTAALLRQLSTWPSSSSQQAERIPSAWEQDLRVGGEAEKKCRRTITQCIRSGWPSSSPSLPGSPADFAGFGETAHDLAKTSALAVVRAAYQAAESKPDLEALASMAEQIHRADPPRSPLDLGKLVREVCSEPAVRRGSLEDAAQTLAEGYLQQRAAAADAWVALGTALGQQQSLLQSLAATDEEEEEQEPSAAPAVATGSHIEQRKAAVRQLSTYVAYLLPSDVPATVATRLFDLSVTQRAMLPVEADTEQGLELVQVSADTRSLLAPGFGTAQKKLTGMQLHHFGAFYKRSWRANDWMWGRLDGAGWLVHVLLDPRRVLRIVEAHQDEVDPGDTRAGWFLGKLKELGGPDFPSDGYQLSASGSGPAPTLDEDSVLDELGFLDEPMTREMPPSLPRTALWLAQAWQQRVLDEELDGLARAVHDPETEVKSDWSPTKSRTWARQVLGSPAGAAKYALLNQDPVAGETFASDKSSPLMARTVTKAAATASGAIGSVRQVPGVLMPAATTLRTLALGGHRVVSATKGVARRIILAGFLVLAFGLVFVQGGTFFEVTGLVMAAVGGYLVVLGTWQLSSRLLGALVSVTVVVALYALTTEFIRDWLFGTKKDAGLVGENAYWVGTQWWHPLVVLGAVALLVVVLTVLTKGRKIEPAMQDG